MSRKYKFNQQPEASKEWGSVREVYGDKSIQKISHAFVFVLWKYKIWQNHYLYTNTAPDCVIVSDWSNTSGYNKFKWHAKELSFKTTANSKFQVSIYNVYTSFVASSEDNVLTPSNACRFKHPYPRNIFW